MKKLLLTTLLFSPVAVAVDSIGPSPRCVTSSLSAPVGLYSPKWELNTLPTTVCFRGQDVTQLVTGGGYITSALEIGSGGMDMLYTVRPANIRKPGGLVHVFIDGNDNLVRDVILKEDKADDPTQALFNIQLNWISPTGFVYLTSYPYPGEAVRAIHSFVIPQNNYRTIWSPQKLKYVISGQFYAPGTLSSKPENKERFVVKQLKGGENGLETFMNLVSYDRTKICELDTLSKFWLSEMNCK